MAFEHHFGPKGWEFERSNLQKFKCPGFAREGGGILKFRVDRRIMRNCRISKWNRSELHGDKKVLQPDLTTKFSIQDKGHTTRNTRFSEKTIG